MPLPRTPSLRLDGLRALVTGASSGIGQGCALALAEAGAHVVAVARRPGRLAETVDEIAARGGSAGAVPLDVTDLDALRAFLDGQPPFDVVLHAAGTARHSPATETEPGDFDAVMDLNLRAAYFLSAWTARAMIAAGRPGSIIHISSQMGHVGGPNRAVYCASKHGVEGFVRAMAIEFGAHDIRINTICPTFVLTELTEASFDDPETRAWIEARIKLPRAARVEDIMGAAVYLAGPASAMVTGTALRVDGGWTAE